MEYPIGGYAPGNYWCTCITCKNTFTGDKRAIQCEPCALKSQEKRYTLEQIRTYLKSQDSFGDVLYNLKNIDKWI